MTKEEKVIYGEQCADVYDQWFSALEERAVERLAELAGGGRALELGIGTGLVALPLAARGVEVAGVDSSEAMVARLRAKPGGDRVRVTMGNFADVAVDGKFSLIFVVYNTFFALQTQEEQVRCFRNVAEHLEEGGVFVVETFVPDAALLDRAGDVRATAVTEGRVGLKVSRHDPVGQKLRSQHVVFTDGGVSLYPVEVRYVWPAELDLMARLAGLSLRERWGGWGREEFNAGSVKHVSVYERGADGAA
jgi:SAM-dependent methyltransferase